jgi:hypothetical protein
VFTARYGLSPYIEQIRFLFKGLKLFCDLKLSVNSGYQTIPRVLQYSRMDQEFMLPVETVSIERNCQNECLIRRPLCTLLGEDGLRLCCRNLQRL